MVVQKTLFIELSILFYICFHGLYFIFMCILFEKEKKKKKTKKLNDIVIYPEALCKVFMKAIVGD